MPLIPNYAKSSESFAVEKMKKARIEVLSALILLNKWNTDLSGRLKKIKTGKKEPKWYVRRDSNPGHLHMLPRRHFSQCGSLDVFNPVFARCDYMI